jgi:S-adenosylmethionine synthetase
MKVLITGATGLLGRAIRKEFETTDWEILSLGFSREHAEIIKLDLTDFDLVRMLIMTEKPDIIIHSAAERRPDVTDNNPDAATELNVDATANLAKLADKYGIFIVYMSTDYVFDGTKAPYSTTDKPNPINLYGKTKFLGEQAVEKDAKNYAILRVPILYGDQESLNESAATVIINQIKDNPGLKIDNWAARFPTYVGDVAFTLRQLMAKIDIKKCQDIFHWSGNEEFTKYSMAKVMGEILDVDVSKIQPNNEPTAGAPRPKNCQLDCSKIESLGIGRRTSFFQVVEKHLVI